MFTGSIVALVTPMDAAGSVDYVALQNLVEFHIEQGTNAIVAVGTTGESATLPVAEHVEVVKKTVEFAAGRIDVIAGNGANATAESVELTKLLTEVGVQGFLTVVPYYNKPTANGMLAHFKAVAASTHLPVLLYNVPGRTACDMLPETIIALSEVENIVGVKEATGELSRLHTIKQAVADDFMLLSGDDCSACDFVLQGGHGVISVTANAAPALMSKMIAAARKGDEATASALDKQLQPLHDAMFCQANPIPVKWAMYKMNLLPTANLRLPLLPLESEFHQQVIDAMDLAGVKEC